MHLLPNLQYLANTEAQLVLPADNFFRLSLSWYFCVSFINSTLHMSAVSFSLTIYFKHKRAHPSTHCHFRLIIRETAQWSVVSTMLVSHFQFRSGGFRWLTEKENHPQRQWAKRKLIFWGVSFSWKFSKYKSRDARLCLRHTTLSWAWRKQHDWRIDCQGMLLQVKFIT